MTVSVEVLTSIDQLDPAAYLALRRSCGPSAFYDPRFLAGVERSPLLPVEKTYYLVAHDGAVLVALMPAYVQSPSIVDPFGVLAQTTSLRFEPHARGLFSHVMHCYDSTIVGHCGAAVLVPMFERLAEVARAEGAQHFVMMNVAEGPLLKAARGLGLEVNYMFDRFQIALSGIRDFDALVAEGLPSHGRCEMRRQLRKFAASGARAVVETAPFRRLDELAELCHLTTKRRGTPQYLPAVPLAQLVASCGDMMRFVMVYAGERMLGGFICIDDAAVLHIWLAGITYEGLDFSPYTICFAEAYRYALARGKTHVEAGRLNAKIKERLGLSALPLHSILSPDLRAQRARRARPAERLRSARQPRLTGKSAARLSAHPPEVHSRDPGHVVLGEHLEAHATVKLDARGLVGLQIRREPVGVGPVGQGAQERAAEAKALVGRVDAQHEQVVVRLADVMPREVGVGLEEVHDAAPARSGAPPCMPEERRESMRVLAGGADQGRSCHLPVHPDTVGLLPAHCRRGEPVLHAGHDARPPGIGQVGEDGPVGRIVAKGPAEQRRCVRNVFQGERSDVVHVTLTRASTRRAHGKAPGRQDLHMLVASSGHGSHASPIPSLPRHQPALPCPSGGSG